MNRFLVCSSSSLTAVALAAMVFLPPGPAQAMCGGMFREKMPREIARLPAEKRPEQWRAKLVNKASKVILVRDGEKTVITMANDVHGPIKRFAMVVPVPVPVKKQQVKVVDKSVFADLEDITAPKLEEKIDPNPCPMPTQDMATAAVESESVQRAPSAKSAKKRLRASDFGVKVEEHYQVGEYHIAILKAKESKGLIKWLNIFKYDIPDNATEVFQSYIKQGFSFFVTRVNLDKLEKKTGSRFLRPLQVTYNTPRFGLPIRIGMLNADGPQELLVYAVTPRGRVESTNYRTVRMPTDLELPYFVKDKFNALYESAFTHQSNQQEMSVILLEYAGPSWRQVPGDPWTMAPPQRKGVDLNKIGANWNKQAKVGEPQREAFVTRMHFRYTKSRWPEDLKFQVTDDRKRFDLDYVVRREWTPQGPVCAEGKTYLATLPARHARQAKALADFAGMQEPDVRQRMGLPRDGTAPPPTAPATDDNKQVVLSCGSCNAGSPALAWAFFPMLLFVAHRRRRKRS